MSLECVLFDMDEAMPIVTLLNVHTQLTDVSKLICRFVIDPYPTESIKRKITIFKLIIDKTSQTSVRERAAQLEPPLLISANDIRRTKIFLKFNQYNIR